MTGSRKASRRLRTPGRHLAAATIERYDRCVPTRSRTRRPEGRTAGALTCRSSSRRSPGHRVDRSRTPTPHRPIRRRIRGRRLRARCFGEPDVVDAVAVEEAPPIADYPTATRAFDGRPDPPQPARPGFVLKTPTHLRSGYASWYCMTGVSSCHRAYPGGMYAAAGAALRVGDWRGRTVQVCSGGRCIMVTLTLVPVRRRPDHRPVQRRLSPAGTAGNGDPGGARRLVVSGAAGGASCVPARPPIGQGMRTRPSEPIGKSGL